MLLLIDGDILAYSIPFSLQEKDGSLVDDAEYLLAERLSMFVANVVGDVSEKTGQKVADFKVFLSGDSKDNFRYNHPQIQPYKGTRKAPRPLLYDKCREILADKYAATFSVGMEADDSISIESTALRMMDIPHVICTIDKDMLQLPGLHYRWTIVRANSITPSTLFHVSQREAMFSFYKQALTGDRVDNIPGVKGIGEGKATTLLKDKNTEHEMYTAVLDAYIEDAFINWPCEVDEGIIDPEDDLNTNLTMLYLLRSEDDEWKSPFNRQASPWQSDVGFYIQQKRCQDRG